MNSIWNSRLQLSPKSTHMLTRLHFLENSQHFDNLAYFLTNLRKPFGFQNVILKSCGCSLKLLSVVFQDYYGALMTVVPTTVCTIDKWKQIATSKVKTNHHRPSILRYICPETPSFDFSIPDFVCGSNMNSAPGSGPEVARNEKSYGSGVSWREGDKLPFRVLGHN